MLKKVVFLVWNNLKTGISSKHFKPCDVKNFKTKLIFKNLIFRTNFKFHFFRKQPLILSRGRLINGKQRRLLEGNSRNVQIVGAAEVEEPVVNESFANFVDGPAWWMPRSGDLIRWGRFTSVEIFFGCLKMVHPRYKWQWTTISYWTFSPDNHTICGSSKTYLRKMHPQNLLRATSTSK